MFLMKKLFSIDGLRKATTLAVALSASFFVTNNTYAQPATPCDPQYMEALEARAWLEVNREITQNQNLIAKPDSVLEYTCFNRFLDEAAAGFLPQRQFSETTRWGPIAGFSSATTDLALDEVVGSAFRTYINSNFDHDYLGHRAEGNDYTGYTSPVQSRSYSCAEMSRVWQLAKCTDFFEYDNRDSGGVNRDGFMDFDWYNSTDPRNLPPGSECSPPGTSPGIYSVALETAFNQDAPRREASRYYLPAGAETDFGASPYDVDNVVSHMDFILHQGHPLASSCQTIRTGITVNRVGMSEYPDAICPNPGCHLVFGGGGGGPGGGGSGALCSPN